MLKLFLVGALILALDMVTKGLTYVYLKPFEQVVCLELLGIDFSINHVINRGAAWGVGGAWQELILFARIAIVAGLFSYLCISPKAALQRYAFILIIVGGLGNIIDYFVYGHVIDMFHFIFWGYSFPVFNIADSAIFLGIASLLWKSFNRKDEKTVFRL